MRRSFPVLAALAMAALGGCGERDSGPVDTTLNEAEASAGNQAPATEIPVAPEPAPVDRGAEACSGYYAYVPGSPEMEVPFSLEVQPTAIEVAWMDYSPRVFARKRVQPDGSIVFHAENGGPSTLRCTKDAAALRFSEDLETPRRDYRLVRVSGDVFEVARQRGWEVGD